MQYGKRLLYLVLFAGIAAIASAVEPFEVQVEPSFVAPPSVDYSKSLRGGDPVRQSFVNDWLMITVKFDTVHERTTTKQTRNYAALYKKEWLDNVQLDVRLLIDTGENGATQHNKSGNRYVYMSGKTTFWTINLKSKSHAARFFVPAQLLDRFAFDPPPIRRNRYASGKGGGSMSTKMQKFRVRQFFIEAEFKHQGKVIGVGYFNYGKKVYGARGRVVKTGADFSRILSSVSPHCRWEKAILPRALSPWSLHNPNYYDTEKLPGY